MYHGITRRILQILLICSAVAAAQDIEGEWKDLVVQGLQAAGVNENAKAEATLLRAVKEAEHFGTSDVRVGTTLNSLGLVYKAQNKLTDAELAFRRALVILEKGYGEDSMDVGNVNFNLASVLVSAEKNEQALPYLRITRRIYERHLGGNSPKVASVLCLTGDVQRRQKNFKEAEGNLKQCSQIREATGGMVSEEFGDAMHSLALVYQQEGKYVQADSSFKLAEKIREKTKGIMSPALADSLEAHSSMLKQMGRDDDAQKTAKLAAAIRRTNAKGK